MSETPSSVGRKLLSASVLQGASVIAAGLSSFFLMPFIVRHIGDRLYGFWSLAVVIISYYSVFDLGLSSAISQYICVAIGRSERDECRAIFNTALRIQSVLGGIALLATAAIAVATPWLCRDPADVAVFWKVIAVLGVSGAISFPTRVYAGVLEAELRFDIQSGLAILGVVLRTGLVMLAIHAGGGLLALAWMTLLATFPVAGLQIWFARREAPWARIEKARIALARVKSLFSYSVYTFVSYMADVVRFNLDSLVISGLIGLAAVTHYKVAGVFAQYYLALVSVPVGMLRPVLGRLHGAGDSRSLERVFFFGSKISLWISIFLCLALVGWGRPLIARWMGPSYEDAYLPLVVLSFACFLDVGQKPSIDLLYATFNHRFYTYMNWAEGILNLAFSLALARPLGILGVAMGTLIGAVVVRVAVQPWWVCKVSGIPYAQYVRFVVGTLLRCGGLMIAAIVLSAWGLRPSYPGLVGSAVFATALYLAGSWFLVFDSDERVRLLAAVKNRGQKRADQAIVGATI